MFKLQQMNRRPKGQTGVTSSKTCDSRRFGSIWYGNSSTDWRANLRLMYSLPLNVTCNWYRGHVKVVGDIFTRPGLKRSNPIGLFRGQVVLKI